MDQRTGLGVAEAAVLSRPGEGALQYAGRVAMTCPSQRLWAGLNDVAILAGCVPGLVAYTILEPGRRFSGTAEINLGGNQITIPTEVHWLHLADGRGALAAQAAVVGHPVLCAGEVVLAPAGEDGQAVLHWTAQLTLPAALNENSLMRQMIGSLAARYLRAFWECLKATLEADIPHPA